MSEHKTLRHATMRTSRKVILAPNTRCLQAMSVNLVGYFFRFRDSRLLNVHTSSHSTALTATCVCATSNDCCYCHYLWEETQSSGPTLLKAFAAKRIPLSPKPQFAVAQYRPVLPEPGSLSLVLFINAPPLYCSTIGMNDTNVARAQEAGSPATVTQLLSFVFV